MCAWDATLVKSTTPNEVFHKKRKYMVAFASHRPSKQINSDIGINIARALGRSLLPDFYSSLNRKIPTVYLNNPKVVLPRKLNPN